MAKTLDQASKELDSRSKEIVGRRPNNVAAQLEKGLPKDEPKQQEKSQDDDGKKKSNLSDLEAKFLEVLEQNMTPDRQPGRAKSLYLSAESHDILKKYCKAHKGRSASNVVDGLIRGFLK